MTVPLIKLNDNTTIPQLGYGLWQVSDEETESLVLEAIKTGYRLIDGAQIYHNEAGLGRALDSNQVKRSDLYITTKIWNSEQGYDATLKSFDVSMEKLNLQVLDLLLIHWPAPSKEKFVDTWKALVQLKKDNRVKSIGVSNFTEDHLIQIMDATSVTPVINQVEVHPRFQQVALRDFHFKHNIQTESWSPLGQGHVISDPVIAQIARKHQKSPAQIILRWHMENGLVAIPKSVTSARIRENFQVFDFKLDAEDLSLIKKMDDAAGRIGPDPMTAQF